MFVGIDVVLDLHQAGLLRFGGASGLRDRGAVEAALGAAQNAYFYGNADLYEIAATYAYHIAQAQAFLDGNKRVAVAVALLFLAGNGIAGVPDADRLYDAMIGIAERRLTKADLAQVFRELFS
jgi:death-on-curing protein